MSFSVCGAANAATLYFSPSSGSYSVGKTLTASVFVSSADQAMNAASGIISFDQNKLEIISLSKNGSIFSLWVQEPSFSNTSGTINFEGIVLNPGFIGSGGKAISITFKTKTAGTAAVIFSSGSILANDGKGTNILTGLGSASYNIIAAITTTTLPKTQTVDTRTPKAVNIYSSTHPDPNKWYSDETAKFSWKLTDDITESRLLISKSANAVPTVNYSPAVSSKTVTNLGEGVWYFYVQLKNEYGWGDIARFRLQINDVSLAPLNIRIDNEGDIDTKLPMHNPLENTRFASFGYVIINNLPLFFIVSIIFSLGFIILLIILSLYRWRAKFLREGLKEEAKKTEKILYQAFDNLRKEVTKQVAKLDGNDVLSEREEEINEELKKSIRNSEQIINEKLKHIEEKINGVK